MKVGILSESTADEAAVRILAEAVLGRPLETVPIRFRTRGWTAVLSTLPTAFKTLHWQLDTDGLIVVLDSDDTPVHVAAHEADGFQDADCRYCRIHRLFMKLGTSITPRAQPPLKFAIGLAVPAIEAWYRCGLDVHCTEAHFAREATTRLASLRRELKRDCYGTFPAAQAVMKQKAIEHATRLAKDISAFERHFPNGFGTLAHSLRVW